MPMLLLTTFTSEVFIPECSWCFCIDGETQTGKRHHTFHVTDRALYQFQHCAVEEYNCWGFAADPQRPSHPCEI